MSSDLSQAVLDRELKPALPAVRFLEMCESTNIEAMRWSGEGAPDGAIVVADHQTAGRGRSGRSWVSEPGSALLFSLILRPQIPADLLPLANLAGAVAVADALLNLGIEPSLKWPNDVLVGEKKICGILSEVTGVASSACIVLGVGVNVNQTLDTFPQEIRGSATSMRIEKNKKFERPHVLKSVVDALGLRYLQLLTGSRPALLEAYRKACATIGRRVKVEMSDQAFESVAASIDDSGSLVLEGGQVVRAGDIIHLR